MSELEARIQRLEDIETIKQLKSRYFRACDRKDVATIRECYAEGEIEIEFGRVGSYKNREDLVAVFDSLAVHDHIIEMHHGQNPEVEILRDDRARGRWGLYYFLINPRDNTITQLGASYHDEFVKKNGIWRICKTECVVHSTVLMDISEGMAKILFAGQQAPTDLDDPSKQAG